jgi:flagellar hook-length control protein FliK
MPVASNPLLQPASATQTSTANALLSSKTQEAAPSGADSFASVYSRQSQADYAQKADAAQAYADKLANAAANKSSFASQPDPARPAVADSGKDLPAKAKPAADDNKVDSTKNDSNKVDSTKGNDKKVAGKDEDKDQDDSAKADDAKAAKSDKAADAAANDDANAAAKAADAALDPSLLKPVVDPAATAAASVPAAATPAVDPNLLAMVAPPTTAAQDAAKDTSKSDDDFDPHADPLADMPTLRLALEQNAKAQGTTSAHAADSNQAATAGQADDSAAVAGLTTLIQQQAGAEGKAGSGDKGLGAATAENGVNGIKGGIGDASASGFGDRLSALTQATGKSASSAPAAPPASPLAMNQSGWTEGVVNRVMYLSSQNLKSADIQLSPAELGRLDIKVTMSNDQQTQVTFMSSHVGVREALENQQGRLKEMFAQQGLGQMDVNVSDQSRQQQQNGQPQAQHTSGGSGGRLGRSDGVDSDSGGSEVAQVIHSTSVIGTSAVDYYA